MPTRIKAGTSTSGGVFEPDTAGTLELQTGSTPTTALAIDASQNVGIGTSSPTSYGGFTTLAINNSSNGGLLDFVTNGIVQGQIFSTTSEMRFTKIGANFTSFYTNGSERVRINSTGGVSVGTTTALATLTVNGNITPVQAPSSNWGIDFAPSTSAGSFVTIANDATYDLAAGSGLVYVYDNAGNGAAQYFAFFGSTSVTNLTGGFFAATINTAGKVNFYYESGTARYRFQNKTGSTVNLFISTIRLRASA